MERIKQYRVVMVMLVMVSILVIIRSVSNTHFKPDANKLAEPSIMRSNLISNEELAAISGDILLINLGDTKAEGIDQSTKTEVTKISPNDILEKSNIKKLAGFKGSIVLFSKDTEISARMWMFLSQMGIEDLFILTTDKENESFNNKFRPDTFTRPEL